MNFIVYIALPPPPKKIKKVPGHGYVRKYDIIIEYHDELWLSKRRSRKNIVPTLGGLNTDVTNTWRMWFFNERTEKCLIIELGNLAVKTGKFFFFFFFPRETQRNYNRQVRLAGKTRSREIRKPIGKVNDAIWDSEEMFPNETKSISREDVLYSYSFGYMQNSTRDASLSLDKNTISTYERINNSFFFFFFQK